MSVDSELDELRDPPIPDGSDPTIDPDTGTVSHEERDEDGNVVRDRPDYIPPEERETPFDDEEARLLAKASRDRAIKGALVLGGLYWLS